MSFPATNLNINVICGWKVIKIQKFLILRKTCFHFILGRTRVSNQRLIQLSNFHYCWFQSSIFYFANIFKTNLFIIFIKVAGEFFFYRTGSLFFFLLLWTKNIQFINKRYMKNGLQYFEAKKKKVASASVKQYIFSIFPKKLIHFLDLVYTKFSESSSESFSVV